MPLIKIDMDKKFTKAAEEILIKVSEKVETDDFRKRVEEFLKEIKKLEGKYNLVFIPDIKIVNKKV